jgi:cysteine desulfuration protein SufE
MEDIPSKLKEMIELFEAIPDRAGRIEALISLAERFRGVPEGIATRPYPESRRVQECESEAYVWAEELDDGTLRFHFAVENPQGISAMATAVLLNETLSGAPPDQVARVPRDIIYTFFGRELSMGKSMGLMGIINRVRGYAKRAAASGLSPKTAP